jgi:hypothetical protein
MRPCLRFALLVGLLVLPATPATAWNELGHMVVAKLAWERLDARQKEATYATLQHLPYFEKFMSERARPAGYSAAEWAFLNASTWPDWLRDFTKTGTRPDADISQYHIGPRHYINLVTTPADLADPNAKAAPPDAKTASEESIVTGIRGCMKQLGDKATAPRERALALAWLLHLTGDIHQPLHCGSLYSPDYPAPQGDLGGNVRWIRTPDGPKNFHAYWDDLPGPTEGYGRVPFPKGAADRIGDRIREQYGLLRGAPYERAAYAEQLKHADALDWALEGNALARRSAYTYKGESLPGYPIPNYYQLPAEEKRTEAAKAPALPAGYAEAALAVARRQMALAGYRLADQIQAIFPAKGP